jgi:hypothetical protein
MRIELLLIKKIIRFADLLKKAHYLNHNRIHLENAR